jgi:hypothetical protein
MHSNESHARKLTGKYTSRVEITHKYGNLAVQCTANKTDLLSNGNQGPVTR